jgi:hypothetical protein
MIRKKATKIFGISLLMIALSAGAGAQFTRIGGGLTFCTGIENLEHKTGNPGITARGVLEIGEKLWFEPGLTFYMPGKRQYSTTFFGTLDADFTYTLGSEGSILFYALAGPSLSFLSTSFETIDNESEILPALNIGTGIEMIVEKNVNAFAQIKGVVGTYSQYLTISIGAHYYFTGRRYKTW